MIPNRFDVVQQLAADGYFARAAAGDQKAASLFARLCAVRMNPSGAADSFGWLTKQPGETQVDGYAEDAIVYGSTPSDLSNVVDLVTGAGAAGASIAWQAGKPRRPSNVWARPRPLTADELAYLRPGGGEPQPEPEPEPAACQFRPVDQSETHARLATIGDRLDSLEDAVVTAEAAAIQAREMVQQLIAVLHDNGLQVEASAKFIGPIRGTATLPRG